MPFYKLKIGPSLFFLFFLFIITYLILPAERRWFLKNKQKTTKKTTHCYKLKIGPIMLRNMLGPVFNLYLDQFLTYKICYFCLFFFWGGGGAETPIFIVFSAKNAKF